MDGQVTSPPIHPVVIMRMIGNNYRKGNDDENKGIRDAGSTADFGILFEILKFKKLKIRKFGKFWNIWKILENLENLENFGKFWKNL